MSNNELREHKAKDKVKWICTAVAFVLVAVLLIGLCVQVFAPDGKKVTDWFSKTECEHTDADGDGICDNCGEEVPADETDNEELIVTPVVSKNLIMEATAYADTPYADTSYANDDGTALVNGTTYTLTVTPDPVDAMDTYVWSSSDTTYVTLYTSSDTKSCTVTVKSAFGTQITVTCTSAVNSDVTAAVTLDYVKKISSVTVTAPTSIAFNDSGITYTATATPVYGTGTITPDTFTITGGTLKNNLSVTDQVSNKVQTDTNYYTVYYRTASLADYTFTGATLSLTDPYSAFVSGTTTSKSTTAGNLYDSVPDTGATYSESDYSGIVAYTLGLTYPTVSQLQTAYNNSVISNAAKASTDGTLTITYTYSYNGITLGTGTASVGVAFDMSAMTVNAANISTNKTTIIFY